MKPATWMCLAALLAAAPAAGAQVVNGTVMSDRGAPVPHAIVVVAERDGTLVAVTTADLAGRFSLDLPAGGSYRLRVRGDASADRRFRVADDGTYTAHVHLATHHGMDREDPASRRPTGADGRPLGRPSPGGTGGSGAARAGEDH